MNKVRLGDVATYINGYAFKPDDRGSVGLPIIRIQDLTGNSYDLGFYDGEYPQKIEINDGDVLISWSASLGVYVWNKGKALLNQHIFKVVFDKLEIDKQFFVYAVEHNLQEMVKQTHGATMKHIIKKDFDNTLIPYPSLEQQKCIAKSLDKACNLIEKLKTQYALLDELIKSRFVEMFGDNKYPLVKTSEVCQFVTKGTTPPSSEIFDCYEDGMIPYIKVYNLSFTGDLLFFQHPQYISKEVHSGILSRSKVYPNDVLMNIVGPPLGKFSLVTAEYSEWNINQAIAIFRSKNRIIPYYLLTALMQPDVLRPFLFNAVGVRQQNLSLKQCRNLKIPLPPLNLQNQFADFAPKVEQQKATVQKSIEKLETLKKSLMQEYFG